MSNVLMLSNCPLIESQGSGYVIINTHRSLVALGHAVELISPDSIIKFSFLKNRARIYRLSFGMLHWVFYNKAKIRKSEIIIFYGAESGPAIHYLKKIMKYKGKIILHSNGIESHVEYALNYFYKYLKQVITKIKINPSFIYKLAYKNIDALITVSDYDRNYAVAEMKMDRKKVFSLNPGLPPVFFSENEVSIKKKQIITFCGSWIERKGVNEIALAIPEVLEKNPAYFFRIIGCGSDFEVGKIFPNEIVDQIEVIPFVDNKKELIKLYLESSIFLFPSFCESFGLVLAEAMFCECAAICGPTGFAAELSDGTDAIVLQEPSFVNIKEALFNLIGDDNYRYTIAKNGRRKVANLNWENYKVKIDLTIKSILDN